MTGVIDWAAGRARMILAFIALSIGAGTFAVMKNGAFVERVDIADMRRGAVRHPYTRHLLDSSVGRIRS